MTRAVPRVAVIGHFDKGMSAADGQTVKTRTMFDLFSDVCGPGNVAGVDTHGWTRHPLSLLGECKIAAERSDVLVMLPAQNGVKIFGPLIQRLARKYGCRAIYSVVGGWLPDFLSDKPRLANVLREFDDILVESEVMASKLKGLGFSNVSLFRNFKRLPMKTLDELLEPFYDPFRFVYFARIEKDKGIEDAIWAVAETNKKFHCRYALDIYGQVKAGYEAEFESLLKAANDPHIVYKGCIEPSESLEAFAGALALLFPTRHFSEGIPGTLIDAFCSGTPVIVSRWQSWTEMVYDGRNGLSYAFGEREALHELLLREDLPEHLISMRAGSLASADAYRYGAGITAVRELLECDSLQDRGVRC